MVQGLNSVISIEKCAKISNEKSAQTFSKINLHKSRVIKVIIPIV